MPRNADGGDTGLKAPARLPKQVLRASSYHSAFCSLVPSFSAIISTGAWALAAIFLLL
jgi:hypothetical protein